MLQRLYSHVAEAIQPCCRGYTVMSGGYTVMFRRLYSHVAEAIQPCWGCYMCIYLIIEPPQPGLSCFWLLVGLWQKCYKSVFMVYSIIVYEFNTLYMGIQGKIRKGLGEVGRGWKKLG